MPKQGIYEESGWVAKVNILEDNSDTEWEKFQLEVVETFHNSPIFGTPPNGHVFEASAARGFRHYVGWRLKVSPS